MEVARVLWVRLTSEIDFILYIYLIHNNPPGQLSHLEELTQFLEDIMEELL